MLPIKLIENSDLAVPKNILFIRSYLLYYTKSVQNVSDLCLNFVLVCEIVKISIRSGNENVERIQALINHRPVVDEYFGLHLFGMALVSFVSPHNIAFCNFYY